MRICDKCNKETEIIIQEEAIARDERGETEGKKKIKEKKEYLKEYERAVRQMERSELKIKEMRLGRMIPAIVNDGMPHASSNNDLSGYAALLEQEEKRYMRCRYQRIKICREITDRIEELSDEDEKDVLMYRYIKLMKWVDIADKMELSYKGVHKIHGRALDHFTIKKKT